jgi:uncharacterized protein (TIGR02001 family)
LWGAANGRQSCLGAGMQASKRCHLCTVQNIVRVWSVVLSWGVFGSAWAGASDYEINAALGVDSVSVFRGQKSTTLNPSVSGIVTVERGDMFGGMFIAPVSISGEVTPFVLGYGGYASSVGVLDWNVGARYYAFVGSSDFVIDLDRDGMPENVGRKGFYEGFFGAAIPLGEATLSASVFYSPNVFGETGGAYYFSGGVDVPLGAEFELRGKVSASEFTNNRFNNDYLDYAVGVYRGFFGFDMFLRYSDTIGLSGSDDRVVVFGIEKSWTVMSSHRDHERRNRKIRNELVMDKSQFLGARH